LKSTKRDANKDRTIKPEVADCKIKATYQIIPDSCGSLQNLTLDEIVNYAPLNGCMLNAVITISGDVRLYNLDTQTFESDSFFKLEDVALLSKVVERSARVRYMPKKSNLDWTS